MFAQGYEYIWDALIEDGFSAHEQGRFRDAETHYRAALVLAEEGNIIIHSKVAELFLLLGDTYSAQKQHASAEKSYRCALAIYESIPEASTVDLSIALKRISEMCRAQRRAGEASVLGRCAERLLDLKRQTLELIYCRSSVIRHFPDSLHNGS